MCECSGITAARARGTLVLRSTTVKNIREGKVRKGNPFQAAEIAGTLAVKRTPDILPHCHHAHLERVEFDFFIDGNRIIAECEVRARGSDEADMRALVGVSVALLTIWDMVRDMEAEGEGAYPMTQINSVEIVRSEENT